MSFTVVDKRGVRSPEHVARIEAVRVRDADRAADAVLAEYTRRGKTDFAQQAAGSMFWEAQAAAQNGNAALAESILNEHAAFVRGARQKGILSQ